MKDISSILFRHLKKDPYFLERVRFFQNFIQPVDYDNNMSFIETTELFFNSLKRSKLSNDLKVNLVSLLLTGTYPEEKYISKYSFSLNQDKYLPLINNLLTSKLFNLNKKNKTYFTFYQPNDDELLVDVTHTWHYKFNSGIQRVVRNLCFQLFNQHEVKGKLIYFDKLDNKFIPLSEVDLNEFFIWKRSPADNNFGVIVNNSNKSFKIGLKNILIKLNLFKPIVKLKNKLFHKIICFKRQILLYLPHQSEITLRNKKHNNLLRIPFFWQSHFHLPELADNELRINTLLNIFKNFEVKSSIIIYDLIPVYWPEFCMVTNEFVSYLRLLRHIKKVSAISNFTKNECENYLKNVFQGKIIPEVKSHYLGGDFHDSRSLRSNETKCQTPLVSCIGTIEPRKNQISVLRAAILSMDKGIKFKLLFAGNAGWKNDEFIKEFLYYEKLGYNIELKQCVTDSELDQIYCESRFTIFCSLAEGFGLPIIESLINKKPCLTSNYGSMKEIGEILGGCEFVNPNSIRSMSQKIEKLLSDDNYIEHLKNRIELSKKQFTWSHYAESVYKFIMQ